MPGTIQDAAPVIVFNKTDHRLMISLVNDSGARLNPGTEVVLKSNGTADKRDAGTEYPFGTVEIGEENGKRVTVSVNGQIAKEVSASGGTINANTFVKQTGNFDANGYPTVVACVAGDYASMLVFKGGAAGTLIKVLVLHAPFQVNP